MTRPGSDDPSGEPGDDQARIRSLSFEQALAELEKIVRRLESGQTSLEDSIRDFERGTLLRRQAEDRLTQARLKVERILERPDGSLGSSPAPDLEEPQAQSRPDPGPGRRAPADSLDDDGIPF